MFVKTGERNTLHQIEITRIYVIKHKLKIICIKTKPYPVKFKKNISIGFNIVKIMVIVKHFI